jgi:hypothetical protein
MRVLWRALRDSYGTVLGSFKLRPVMVTRMRRVRLGDAAPAIRLGRRS